MTTNLQGEKKKIEFTEIEIVEFKSTMKVGVTVSMLMMEARSRGVFYFKDGGGRIYKLECLQE